MNKIHRSMTVLLSIYSVAFCAGITHANSASQPERISPQKNQSRSLEGTTWKTISESQTGDRIIKIDGRATYGMTLETATGLLRGNVGTGVTVTIQIPGTNRERDITLTREKIKAEPTPAPNQQKPPAPNPTPARLL